MNVISAASAESENVKSEANAIAPTGKNFILSPDNRFRLKTDARPIVSGMRVAHFPASYFSESAPASAEQSIFGAFPAAFAFSTSLRAASTSARKIGSA